MKIVKESILKGPNKEEIYSKLFNDYPPLKDAIEDLEKMGFNHEMNTTFGYIEFTLQKSDYEIEIKYDPNPIYNKSWTIRFFRRNLAYKSPIESFRWEDIRDILKKEYKKVINESILKKEYKKVINESILKPKSKEEIRKEIYTGKYKPHEVLMAGSRIGDLKVVKHAFEVEKSSLYVIDTFDINKSIRVSSENGHLNVVKYLMGIKRYDNTPLVNGSILYYAVLRNQEHIVNYLLNNFEIDENKLAEVIHVSLYEGYEDIVKILEDYRDKIEKEQGF